MASTPSVYQRPNRRGFSLLELLAVVTIMGIIAAIVVPRLTYSTTTAKQNGELQYRGDLNNAIEKYYFDRSAFPPDLDTLYTDGYYPAPIPNNPVTNVPFVLDPATNRVKI
ncbi:MAG TPA: type II secretion system protein [Pirellulaceae bacterium]|nr:type II secretion system protein [Pirellulaceae bacterium]